nr:copia protein [Tanacetum cinerariifolium]
MIFQRSRDEKNDKSDRKCFRCDDPNHLIGKCPKLSKDKNQRVFVGGSWSDSGEEDDEKVKNKTCLIAQASSEVCFESSYFSDENSSIDDLALDNEYDKLCKMSLKIITKNKRLKATRNSLEKEISILKEKVSTLKKNKEVDLDCVKCHMLKIENKKLKEEALKVTKFEKSTYCLNEMLNNQKPSGEKLGLVYNSFEASSSGTKEIKFVKAQKKVSPDRGPINMGGPFNLQVTPKVNMGPPPGTTPGSEKSYSQNSKVNTILNKHTRKVKESLNVTFDETPPPSKTSPLVDDDLDQDEAIMITENKNLENDIVDETLENDEIVNIKESRNHPLENVIGNLNQRTLRPNIMFSVCLCARFQEAPKTSHLEAIKRIFRYIKGTMHLRLWYPKGNSIETVVYADSDHAGDYVDRKITNGICTFVGCCLTSWFSKKQTSLAISTTEAEYVSAKKACQQALWMKQALIDYDVRLDDVPIMRDNKGATDLSKNPMQHSHTKHIEIRHHFLRDNVQKGHISIEKVSSVDNIADILTKPLKCESFNYLRLGLGMMEHIPLDHQMTQNYIPHISNEFNQPLQYTIANLENDTFMRVGIIHENAICLGGHKDHVFAGLCHMLYCIESSTPNNLAFFILKRMEKTQNKPKELFSYGMLLARLFKHVVSVSPELAFDHYLSHDRAMHPLAPHYDRKTRSNHGNKRPRESNTSSPSSSTTQNHPSLSLPLDAASDENDDESFHSHSSSSQNISSSSDVVLRVRQNLPHESHDLNTYLLKP